MPAPMPRRRDHASPTGARRRAGGPASAHPPRTVEPSRRTQEQATPTRERTPQPPRSSRSAKRERRVLRGVRFWLPLVIIVAGVIVAIVDRSVGLEIAAMLIGAGLSVWLLNWLHRVGVDGDEDRDREEQARRYFDEHGVWPDEAPRRV